MTRTAEETNSRPLRVLIYANVDGSQAGGVQAVVKGLRQFLARQGHRVAIGWAEMSEQNNAHVNGWVSQFPVRDGKRRWLHLKTAARLTLRLLRERPDVVNIHYASPSVRYFTAFAPLLGYRTVLTCHGSDVLRPLPEDKPHLPAILAGPDAVTAVSDSLAVAVREHLSAKATEVSVLPNGVDTEFWCPSSDVPPAEHDTIVAIGRLERVKGFDVLLQAFSTIHSQRPNSRLVLIGDGSQRKALELQSKKLGIEAAAEFTGRLAREEIRRRFNQAKILAMPSRSEGMPLALLEAMATGLACVACDVGGVAQTGKDAIRLIHAEDADALTVEICSLLENSDAQLALGNKARERAMAFSVAKTHRNYEALMLELGRRSGQFAYGRRIGAPAT